MAKQRTLASAIELNGREPYGGNLVKLVISPSSENNGRVFHTNKGSVKADLDYAKECGSAICLDNGDVSVNHVEHLLGTLEAYAVDNVDIYLERIPSTSYKILRKMNLASQVEVVPVFDGRQKLLCSCLDAVGIVEQEAKREKIRIIEPFLTEKLSFFPSFEGGYSVEVVTDYKVPGEERFVLDVNSKSYSEDVAQARPFVKHAFAGLPVSILDCLAKFSYLNYGFGHGFSVDNYFLGPNNIEEWREREIYPSEIARHGVMDRLGAIALFGGRFDGVEVKAKFSGHQNDIDVLKGLRDRIS